jgi:hypothetical protein
MASAKPKEFSRPETDYERWLRGQDEHYKPGDQPIYGPPVQGVDDPIENGKGKDRLSDGRDKSHPESQEQIICQGSFAHPPTSRLIGLTSYSMICSIILSVFLTIIIIKSAKVLRKRRHRGGEIPLPGKAQDK